MAANRSSTINLYAASDKADDDLRVEFETTSADFKMSGNQDAVFDFNQYSFAKMESGSKVEYDLETRFASLENDAVPGNNAAAIAALQVDLATEQNARQSGDTSNGNAISAETNARVAAVQVIQDALDVQEAKQEADKVASNAATAQEVTDRQAAIQTEQAARAADVAALQSQITSILSNADPALIDSIAELLSHVNSEDASLLASVATAQALADQNKLRLDELTQE